MRSFFFFWEYWIELYRQVRTWITVYNLFQNPKVQENLKNCPYELRMNWIGTIYTVINLPDEFIENADEQNIEAFIREQLHFIDRYLMMDGISTVVYPEIKEIPNTSAYLVKFKTFKDNIQLHKIIWQILKLYLFYKVGFGLYWFIDYLGGFTWIFNYIF